MGPLTWSPVAQALAAAWVVCIAVFLFCALTDRPAHRDEAFRLAELARLRREARRLEARSEARAAWRRARLFGNEVVEWRNRGLA